MPGSVQYAPARERYDAGDRGCEYFPNNYPAPEPEKLSTWCAWMTVSLCDPLPYVQSEPCLLRVRGQLFMRDGRNRF